MTYSTLDQYAESILELNPEIDYIDFKELMDNFTTTTAKDA